MNKHGQVSNEILEIMDRYNVDQEDAEILLALEKAEEEDCECKD